MSISDFKDIKKEAFGSDFQWGISTAAYQIEGAYNEDGKGESIWDTFTAKKGKIKNRDHGRVACDFYHRYESDIRLIRDLNIPNFRFSISWSRILPTGVASVNQAGIDYYNRVIDYALACGITPWITLYHWDLPHALERKGGWTNRDIIGWFSDYVQLCVKMFGDRVKHWMVMNEPSVFTGAGYFFGIHAPGRTGLSNFLAAIHHATLCTASGGKIIKDLLSDSEVGTTFSCTHIEPYSLAERHVKAAGRVDALLNRTFIEPILGLGYPKTDLPVLNRIDRYVETGDEERCKFDFDFIGLQNYTREVVRYSFFTPYIAANLVKAEKRNVPVTEMKWEVYPASMYHILKKFNQYPQIRKILITENGAAFPDFPTGNQVNDSKRVRYLQENLWWLLKAKQEGCKVDGYFVWTLIDNFEWAEGYHPRFGLVYVDFETQRRLVKQSGIWYRDFLK
jgi:beta-glucosidase